MSGTSTERPALRPAWEVFTRAFGAWKANWRLFTGIQVLWAAGSIATVILAALVAGFLTASSGIFSGELAGPAVTRALLTDPGALATLIVCGVLALAVLAIASAWHSLATVVAWERVEAAEETTVREAYARSWRLVPRYLWISIVAVALVVLGFFGFVIPGVMLGVAFLLLPIVTVQEGLAGRHAIMRTTRLARPHLPRLFWRALLATLVVYVPAWIVAGILNAMLGEGVGDAADQLYGLVMAPIFSGVLFMSYREFLAAEREQKLLVWLSLERLALIAAGVAALTVTAFMVFGR